MIVWAIISHIYIMRIEVQVIANSVIQRVPAIFLHAKTNKYLFNTP